MNKQSTFIKRGYEVKLATKGATTIVFPTVVLPQYFDSDNNKYVSIQSKEELQELKAKGISVEYGGLLLIKKGTKDAKLVTDAVDKVWKDFKLKDQRKANYPIEDGDEKADKMEADQKNGDMYRGMIVIKTGTQNKKREFQSFNKYGKYKPSSNDEVNGYYVHLGLYIGYYYKSTSVLGVKAYLNAIQYLDKNPDINIATDYSTEFSFENASDDEFNKAVGDNEDFDGGVPLTDGENGEDDEVFGS